jgi:glyceraldehyde 3-phosphate dehydrogenase
MTIRIGINGFGRIGRNVMRHVLSGSRDIEVAHINDLTDNEMLAHLLKYDSVHGNLSSEITADDKQIYIDGKGVSASAIRSPAEIPWGDKGVDIVFECTGIFRDRDSAAMHQKAGAKKVLISAPAKGEDRTVVFGVNHKDLTPQDTVVSNGSCTTNCLAPVAKVLHEGWGIQKGTMTTVHAYTSDQRILDAPHKDKRRARAAAVSMIPTTTGAAKAISLVIPELKDKIHGMAIRVPTPNVSMIDLSLQLGKSVTAETINGALKEASKGPLRGVLGFSDLPLVSSDYNGSPLSSVVDGVSTTVVGGDLVKVVSWYDNESGFSARMLDVAAYMQSLA